MAYLVGRLFDEMAIPQSDRLILTARCITADIEEAIDVAFIDAAMIEEILGEDAGRLGGVLLDAARRAIPMVAGWARAGVLFGGVGGSCPARGLSSSKPPGRATPRQGEPPVPSPVLVARPWLRRKRGGRILLWFAPLVSWCLSPEII